MSTNSERVLRLAHLYPNLMNLYGDRGNIYCLRHRCEARGIALQVDELGLGDEFTPQEYDLVFMGGGQDREQRRIAEDLLERKAPGLRDAIEADMPVLTVCGGYQMMGEYYRGANGERISGAGIFDAVTVHPGETESRCIGNIEIDWNGDNLVGFENHGGRTFLGPRAVALGRVAAGFGNNGEDGTEGCRYHNAIGTYMHGSLLPKNPQLADYLLSLALERKYGHSRLAPIDDSLEQEAHQSAALIARRDARKRSSSARTSAALHRLGSAISAIAGRRPMRRN